MTRSEILESIALLAGYVRDLEKGLTKATDSRLHMERLQDARVELDEALDELRALEKGDKQ